MLKRWIYVSNSALPAELRTAEMAILTEAAATRNAVLSISGVLVNTGPYFAQVVEGSPRAIDVLMASIRRDPRHFDIKDIDQRSIPRRQFKGWMTAYDGDAIYFRNIVLRSLGEAPEIATNRLLRLFLALTAGRPG